MDMKHIITVSLIILLTCLSNSVAQVPVLNASTIKMPKSEVLNKCIDEQNKITYTQFECDQTSVKADNKWLEEANLTFIMPEKYSAFSKDGPLTQWAKSEQQKNKDKTLEEMIEGKNFIELFNMGIQAYIQRAALLNSL